ncbi:MAG: ABC transporter permease [Candidatus Sulfopaludibacter sp.]|nr:ABC transporter permease [Candidatus Sulfopaludibacter sp.]
MKQLQQVGRRLRRSPAFTGIVILTLAVGIGANAAIFSVLNGVLLKPLPFADPGRLVGVWQTAPGLGIKQLEAAPATYFTYREEGRAFQDIGIWRRDSVSVTGIAEPEEVPALEVTDGVLPVLGIAPMLGRGFTRQDDSPGAPKTVILSYGYWQKHFGGDPSALGRILTLDGDLRQIIGVLPRDFRFMNFQHSLVLPFQLDRSKVFVGNFSYQAVARLRSGVTLAAANADVARMIPMLMDKFPPAPGMSPKMLDEARLGANVHSLKEDVVGDVGTVLWLLMGTVGIVLFIACANVANLLLVRAEGRQQELAIRAALGAGWMQVARELLLESLTLGLIGGAAGLGLAYAALRLLVRLGPSSLPRLDEIAIDLPALLFTLAISVGAGLLFGVLPVFKYAGPRLAGTLRQGGRNSSQGRERHRARSVLVVVQVALALVLLISSGLMIRTLVALKHVPPGFTDPTAVLTLRVSMPTAQLREPEQVIQADREILRKVESLPGVDSAAFGSSVTMDGFHDNDPVYADGRVYSESQIPALRRYKFVSPGLFRAMGNPLLAGRDFNWTDNTERRPVVLVSENLAREFWGSPGAALGKRVRENSKGVWREVVGVVGNERDDGADQPANKTIYWPIVVNTFWDQKVNVQRYPALVVRSRRAGSAAFLKEVQQAVWSANPNLTISSVRTLQEVYERSMARTSFTFILLTVAAAMALLLGVVGIYGVISYAVSQRTREIGIRVALGAQQREVRAMFVRHALSLTGIGVACGLVVAAGLTRLVSTLLFGVSALDPLTYGAVSAILVAAALLAGYIPARRATTIEPVDALRAE